MEETDIQQYDGEVMLTNPEDQKIRQPRKVWRPSGLSEEREKEISDAVKKVVARRNSEEQKICQYCRYWKPTSDYCPLLGKCMCPKMEYGYHVEADKIKEDTALIEDDEGWGWCVGPRFGCVHWANQQGSYKHQ